MTIEIVTIIAAILAFIASIISSILSGYSIHVTKKGNKDNIDSNTEISREVQAAENRRIESQIDANIVWNARVEWIQNVRRVTAEFITDCYKYMRENGNSLKESLNLIEEKKLLLILYFGPDGNGADPNKASNILDEQTNNAKNNLIVDLINTICNQIKNYHREEESLKYNKELRSNCSRCESEMENKQYLCETNKYGDKFSEDNCVAYKKELDSKISASYNTIYELYKNINILSETMRIYLKIEWNSAKNREKILTK
ncbi:hypothetical protein [Hungatella hathewayi]|uniref:hypothetical protein n=1 Tax=Hungatella hathewayi TaxID=154046 RepID=UPI00356976F3